jgi:hypothetical protein
MKMLKGRAEQSTPAFLTKLAITSARWYLAEAELWLAKEKAK